MLFVRNYQVLDQSSLEHVNIVPSLPSPVLPPLPLLPPLILPSLSSLPYLLSPLPFLPPLPSSLLPLLCSSSPLLLPSSLPPSLLPSPHSPSSSPPFSLPSLIILFTLITTLSKYCSYTSQVQSYCESAPTCNGTSSGCRQGMYTYGISEH